MEHWAFPSLKRAIAALCMALGVIASVHTGMISVEKALHAMGGQHIAHTVAGPVFYGDHAEESAAGVESRGGGADSPLSAVPHHHHFIDSPLALGQPFEHAPGPRLIGDTAQAPFDTSLPPESNPGGLERPPKRI